MTPNSGKIKKRRSKHIPLYNRALGEFIHISNQKSIIRKLSSSQFTGLSILELSLLMRKAICSMKWDVVYWLKDKLDNNVDTSTWYNEFEIAVISGPITIIQFILENGLDIKNFENSIGNVIDGYTLNMAKSRPICIISYLIENGARPTKDKKPLRVWREILNKNWTNIYEPGKRELVYAIIRENEMIHIDFSNYPIHNDICHITQEKLSTFSEIGICQNCDNGFSGSDLKKWLSKTRKCPICKFYEAEFPIAPNFIFLQKKSNMSK